MKTAFFPTLAIAAFIALSLAPGVGAQTGRAEAPRRVPAAGKGPRELRKDFVDATEAYKKSLEDMLALYNREFRKRAEELVERRGLYEQGYISRLELEQSERFLAEAEGKLRETESKIAEADMAIAEAVAHEGLRGLPALGVGEYKENGAYIRYNGAVSWSLQGVQKIQRFFTERFGRMLPISALGQTSVHDRMRLDHRDAMDVALHPDSPEGRALMVYLRRAGIPFIAFRNKVSGSATGAHIHIGGPSPRIASQ